MAFIFAIFSQQPYFIKTFHLNIIIKFPTAGGGYTAPPCCQLLPFPLRSPPWLFTTAAGVVWDRLPTADPGGPAIISSQAYAYYIQNVPFCIFVPTAHRDLSLL